MRLSLSLILCLMVAGCAEALERVPIESAPSWSTATPADEGVDGAQLERLLAALPQGHGLRSFLLLRHGKLISESYWNGADANTLQDLRSATKSITSLLVGVAIGEGLLSSVKAPISATLEVDASKRDLTVEDLLTMRSGLACDDRDPASPGNEERMYGAPEWVKFFLALPVVAPPGTATHYCTGGVMALGRVIETASAQRLSIYAQDRLFGPLHIEHARWATFDEGRGTDSGGHLRLRPRDLAKVGQLLLQHGEWEGRQLVPAAWIDDSMREHTRIDAEQVPYGFLWWLADLPPNVVFASGNGGQLLFIVPSLDVVAVVTGGNYDSPRQAIPFQLFAGALQAVTP